MSADRKSWDPASVQISLTLAGLSLPEVVALMRGLPDGAEMNVKTAQPAIGRLRHEVGISGVSVVGAEHVLKKLEDYWTSLDPDEEDLED